MRNLFRVSADKYTAVAVSTGRDIKSASAAPLAAKAKITTLLVVLIAMFAAALVPLATAQQKPAEANMFSDAIQDIFCLDAAYFYEPEHYSAMGGSMGMVYSSADNVKEYMLDATLPSGETWMGQRHTAYEKYWMSGLNWTVYRGETNPEKTEVTNEKMEQKEVSNRAPEMKDGDPRSPDAMSCFPGVRIATTAAANFIFMVTKMSAAAGGAITAYAFDTSWLKGLNEAAEKAVVGTNGQNGLRDSLYFQFLGLAVFLGSLHLIYVGLIKRRSMEAATSALWMVGATWAGSLLMFNPGLIPDLSERIVSEVTSAVLTGTTGTVTAGSSDELCVPATTGDKSDRVIAAVNCNFWRTFAYEPWVLGQFGAPSSELATIDGQEAPKVELGDGTTVTSWPLFQLESQSIDTYAATGAGDGMYSKKNKWFLVVDVVSGAKGDGNNTYFNAWAGYGFGRVLVAISSLVAALCGLVVVVVFGISSIAYTLGLAVLVGVSPLFLLIGAHPGTGRRIAMEWLELVISTILKRVTLAAMLGLLLMFYSALMTSSTLETWALQTLGIIAISVAFLIYRGTIMELMGRIDLGGFNNFGDNQAGRQMGGVATGVAAGAAGAALGARGIATQAAQRRPGQGKIGRAAAVAGAVGGATAKGAAKGGYYGKAGYRPMGQGFRAGAAAASSAQGKLAGKNSAAAQQAAALAAQKQQKGVQGRNEADNRLNPAKRAAQRSRDDKRNREYARDYNKFKNDPQWREDFKATYGFPPPNPEEKDFMGYGLEADQLRPHQMPQDKPEETEVDENGNPVPVDIDNDENSENGSNGDDKSDSTGDDKSSKTPRPSVVPVAVPVGANAPAGGASGAEGTAPSSHNPDQTRPKTSSSTDSAEGTDGTAGAVGTAGALPSPNGEGKTETQGEAPKQTPGAKSRNGKPHLRVGRAASQTAANSAVSEQGRNGASAPSSHPDANRPRSVSGNSQAALPKPEAQSPAEAKSQSPAQAPRPSAQASAVSQPSTQASRKPQAQAPVSKPQAQASAQAPRAPQPQAQTPAQAPRAPQPQAQAPAQAPRAPQPQAQAPASPAQAPAPKPQAQASPTQAQAPVEPKPAPSTRGVRKPTSPSRVSARPPKAQPPTGEAKPLPPRSDGGGRPRG